MSILNEKARTQTLRKKGPSQGLIVGLVVANLVITASLLWKAFDKQPAAQANGLDAELLRQVAVKLESSGVGSEATAWLERYVTNATLGIEPRCKVAYRLATLKDKEMAYESALSWYYAAEILCKKDALQANIAPRIIALLENLKKFASVRYALNQRTGVDPTNTGKNIKNRVARIGNEIITEADIDDAIGRLPPQASAQMKDPKIRSQYVQQYVAERLLVRRAIRQDIDKKPVVRKQIQAMTQNVLIGEIIRQEMKDISPSAEDIGKFYQTNKKRFGDKPLKDVQQEVVKAYGQQLMMSKYSSLVSEAIKAEDVEIYPQKISFAGDPNQ